MSKGTIEVKTLLLLRHAESSMGDTALDDFDRPLAPRGERAARLMGADMHKLGLEPDLALCSPAVRAKRTWELVSTYLTGNIRVETPEDLYLADVSVMRGLIQATPAEVRVLMLIGHNPGMGALAAKLAVEGEAPELRAMANKYPAGALTEFLCNAEDWRQVEHGRPVRFIRPRDLAADPD